MRRPGCESHELLKTFFTDPKTESKGDGKSEMSELMDFGPAFVNNAIDEFLLNEYKDLIDLGLLDRRASQKVEEQKLVEPR